MMNADATPVRLRRDEAKAKTRAELSAAAERCFLRLGYQGATLDTIAAEAGFTKGAVYWHFQNKEKLFLELLADAMKQNVDATAQILMQMEDNPERLDESLGAWFDAFDGSNSVPFLALELHFEARRNPALATALDDLILNQETAVKRLLERYFAAVHRTPSMTLIELASTMIAIPKVVALTPKSSKDVGLSSAKIIRILLGMPCGADVDSRT